MDLSDFIPKGSPASWSPKQRIIAMGAFAVLGLGFLYILRGRRADDQVVDGGEDERGNEHEQATPKRRGRKPRAAAAPEPAPAPAAEGGAQ